MVCQPLSSRASPWRQDRGARALGTRRTAHIPVIRGLTRLGTCLAVHDRAMRTQTALVLLVALGSSAFAGCSSSSSSSDGPTGQVRASLHRAKSCPDLLGDLKSDATTKLDRAVDRAIDDIRRCQAERADSECGYGGYAYGGGLSKGVPEAAPAADGAATGAGAQGAPAPSNEASSYSETNTQVKGVDEADIVKNDGKNLYVLHGRSFKIVKAWPATELADAASLDIEGVPSEMFVSDGKAVVYSTVNGTAVFQAAGKTPKEAYQDYGYYGGGGVARPMPASDVAAPDYPGTGTSGPYTPLTKITVLDLTSGTPTVAREVWFEGSYLSSRRVGTHVRTVLSGQAYGPKLAYSTYDLAIQSGQDPSQVYANDKTGTQVIAELEQLRAYNHGKIDASQLSDWLPYTFVKNGAGIAAKTVACEDFYVPTAGSTESGITEVAAIDLANPSADPRETAILGRADTVYANAGKMVLAAHAWIEPPHVVYGSSSGGDSVASTGSAGAGEATAPPATTAAPPPAPSPSPGSATLGTKNLRPLDATGLAAPPRVFNTNATHVHELEFDSDPSFPNYVASGTVKGSVKDQFAIDEKDGKVRIATTESRLYLDESDHYVSPQPNDPNTGAPSPLPSNVNHVFVLGQNGAFLDEVGSVKDLAPNEQIYSVRYVGSRAYVVTFRRVDPLFVIDMANPSSPQVLAALKIPGFSEYMHPLDENHLLTIGRNTDANGRATGLQLQIFDVTNGANPIVAHKFTYDGSEYGSSDAEYDHKAFTYFADKNLLAFPYHSYGSSNMRSSLELFRVDLGTGFSKVGSIDHTSLVSKAPSGWCGGYYGPSVRRGVFMEDFVYSISYGGVVVRDARNIGAAVSQLPLSAPQTNEGYGPACY